MSGCSVAKVPRNTGCLSLAVGRLVGVVVWEVSG